MKHLPRVYPATPLSVILLGLVLLLSSCSEIVLPRLEFEDNSKDPSVPLRVKLELDSSVQQAAFPYKDACGNEKVFPIGIQLSQMLLEDSQKVFQQVVTPQNPTFGYPADAVLQYTVLDSNYDLDIPRLESWAEYPALATLRIQALLHEESTGKKIFSETYEGRGRWRVSSDPDGQDCEPIGIGVPIDTAIKAISKELVDTMRDSGRIQAWAIQLVGKRQQLVAGVPQPSYPNLPLTTPVPGEYPNLVPPVSSPPSPAPHLVTSSVKFRTKLIDANRNLVLEGGEAVKLLLEIQNVGDSTIPSAYVELRGTPVLVGAFKRVVSIPVPLGTLKAGEIRTVEIRGRLPLIKKKIRGELIVGIILSEGLPPGTHSILAEIHPGLISNKRKR